MPRNGCSAGNDQNVQNHSHLWDKISSRIRGRGKLSYRAEYDNSHVLGSASLEMKEHQTAVRQEDFDALLALFSHDRHEAGREYERVRAGLVRFFEFRGCADAFALADETLNRVALKTAGFDRSKGAKLTSYVYGFALNVFREYLRSPQGRELAIETDEFLEKVKAKQPDDPEPMFNCLQSCLEKLASDDRQIFIEYYSRERREKIELRKQMAQRLGCRVEVLHTRVCRLRSSLRTCVTGCVEKS